MPIPTKNPNEEESAFISRCMGNESMLKEYPDQKIRSGICFSQWRKDASNPEDCKDARIAREIWEKRNGPIPKGFDLHHKNGNKKDNSKGNLSLKAHDQHASESRKIKLDSFKKDKYQITNQGFLKAESLATKVGVFVYNHPDGSVTREFRSPEEVFDQESMTSLGLVPITRNHPPGMIDVDNFKKYQVGTTGEIIEQKGDHLGCTALITDKEEVKAILKKFDMGMTDEISLGYKCDVIPGVGEWDGETYDHIQQNIRYNHYSLLDGTGRAGRDARLRLDNKEEIVMFKFKRDKIEIPGLHMDAMDVEIPDEATQVVEKLSGKLDEAVGIVDYLGKAGEAIQGRYDALVEASDKVKKDLEDWQSPTSDKVQGMLKARKDLEDLAGKLKVEHKDKDDKTLRVDIIKAVSPDFDPKDRSDEYVQARFDTIREAVEKTDAGDVSMATFVTNATVLKADAGKPKDPRADMIEYSQGLHSDGSDNGKKWDDMQSCMTSQENLRKFPEQGKRYAFCSKQ